MENWIADKNAIYILWSFGLAFAVIIACILQDLFFQKRTIREIKTRLLATETDQ